MKCDIYKHKDAFTLPHRFDCIHDIQVAHDLSVYQLQNELYSFEIVCVQFVNFWAKPDLNPNPNASTGRIVQHILDFAQSHKLRTT